MGGKGRPRGWLVRVDLRNAVVRGFLVLVLSLGWRVDAGVLQPGLRQLPGIAGCISDSGSASCFDGHDLLDPTSIAVTPDGRHAYATANASDAVLSFTRDPTTGQLTLLGCIADVAVPFLCGEGVALNGTNSVIVSPDGRNVYVSAGVSSSIAIFDRSPSTGFLTQKPGAAGCIKTAGGEGCASGIELASVSGLAMSPDGRNVYAAARADDSVLVFDRDPVTGTLAQKVGGAGCIDETGEGACEDGVALDAPVDVTVSPDGANVYVASQDSSAIAIFDRDRATGVLTQKAGTAGCISQNGGDCLLGKAMSLMTWVTVSADGKNLYGSSSGGVGGLSVFDRDLVNGALTQKAGTAGCFTTDGSAGTCTLGRGIFGVQRAFAGPEGTSLYAAARLASSVAIFDRDPINGTLTQKPGTNACLADDPDCMDGHDLNEASFLTVSPDGRNVYVTAVASESITAFDRFISPFDIDGNGEVDPLTDGILELRHSFGFTGTALVVGAVDDNCTRCTEEDIEGFIESLLP